MFTINDYFLPRTIDEAYRVLNEKRSNAILGGCAFLRMGSKYIGTAVDLSKLDLDFITENDQYIEIGAMTTFREIETSTVLMRHFDGILSKSLCNIVGVQLRNIVTVGATVFSRYGFSDFITALLSLDAEVELYEAGRFTLEDFLEIGIKKDILVKIIIPKTERRAAFQAMRNSNSDYALLNVAVSKKDDDWTIVVGARPNRAKIAKQASIYLGKSRVTDKDIEHAAEITVNELTFGSNMRASREYRETVCRALVKRAIMEVLQ